ncbi:Phosphatidylinositol/phosphatidylcholine transfer protein SFH9, partial [Hondaea fermentalgiana]
SVIITSIIIIIITTSASTSTSSVIGIVIITSSSTSTSTSTSSSTSTSTRRRSPLSARSKTGGDKLSAQAASALGVRAVCEVEENGFMRDKMAHVTTLGISGKRSISDSFNLGDTQVGSVWKPRILMITMSSVVLFSSNKRRGSVSSASAVSTPTASSPINGSKSPSADGSESDVSWSSRSLGLGAGVGELIGMAEDIKTTISMEDVAYACQFVETKAGTDKIVQIRTTSVTGLARTHLIRVKSQEKLDELMNNLEIALKAYRQAVEALKDGLITGGDAFRAFQPVVVTRTSDVSKTPEEVLSRNVAFDKPIRCQRVAETDILRIYFTGPKGVAYCVKLRPMHVRASERVARGADDREDATAMLRGDPLSDANARPLTLTFEANFVKPEPGSEDSAGPHGPSAGNSLPKVSADKVEADVGEHALLFKVKETTLVAIISVFVAIAIVLPRWCYEREYVLALLALPVAAAMLFVRGKQQHKPVSSTSDNDAGSRALNTRGNAVATFKVHDIELRLRSCCEGLEQGVMDADQTEDDLMHEIADRENAAQDAQDNGDASARQLSANIPDSDEKGIEELLQALSGAFDESLTDENCPKKWFDATDNNRKEAVRQWRESLQWRRENEVDKVLSKPQENFFRIKTLFPHAWFGNDSENHLVTLERFSEVRKNVDDLKKAGITPEDFAAHCVFLNEFWIKNRLTKTGRLNKIIDLKGFGLSQLTREVINYFQPMNHAMQQYPELIIKVYVINAPSSFRFIWGAVSPFLAKKTTEKINFPSGSDEKLKALLRSMMDPSILPEEYGGSFTGELRDIAFERSAAASIRKLNRDCGVNSPGDWAPNEFPGEDGISEEVSQLTGTNVLEAAEERPAGVPSAVMLQQEGGDLDSEADHAHLNILSGSWVSNSKESETLDPILELQNINFAKRAVARRLTSNQTIEITRKDNKRHVHIMTTTGPVTNRASGFINAKQPGPALDEPASDTDPGDVDIGVQDDSVVVRTVSAPAHMQGRVREGEKVLQLNFKLENGDRRIVHHGVHAETDDKKVMSIEYQRAKDNQSKTVTVISDRK